MGAHSLIFRRGAETTRTGCLVRADADLPVRAARSAQQAGTRKDARTRAHTCRTASDKGHATPTSPGIPFRKRWYILLVVISFGKYNPHHAASQTQMLQSLFAEAMRFPSGDHAIALKL